MRNFGRVNFRLLYLVLTLLLYTVAVKLSAQEPLVSNIPSGFGINQFQTSENLSSGVLNFSLPIETSIVPVSISYATTGIRVNQRAGLVGLGWNLNAGGFIMRQKQGLADSHGEGYSGPSMRGTSVSSTPLSSNFDNMVASTGNNGTNPSTLWDTQPDIYSFQFLGQGGSFTLSSGRVPLVLGGSLLKVDRTYNTSTNKYTNFTITDEQGNKYLFSTIETVKTKVDNTVIEEYTLKWHLTSITYYATGDQITFSYINGLTHTEQTLFKWRREANPSGINSGTESVEQEYTPKLLNNISYKDADVDFIYGARTDISTLRKLEKISYKINNYTVVEYKFGYLYLGEVGAERLMLSGIQKSNLDLQLYQFSYFGEESGEETLPTYNSPKQDHWGFYNNNTKTSMFTQLSADRSPVLNRTLANSLKKIYSTTGSFQEFEFQLNEYNLSSIDYAAGGLRIHKLHQKSGDGTNYTTKTYSYELAGSNSSSGEIYAVPDVDFRFDDVEANKVYTENREYSLDPLTDILGRHITYKYVTVEDIDHSTIDYEFKTFTDEATLLGSGNVAFRGTKGFNRTTGYIVSPTTVTTNYEGPFGNRNYKGSAAGLVNKITYRDAANNIMSEEVYGYLARGATTTVQGFNYLRQAYRESSNDEIDEYLISVYELGNGYVLNNSIRQITYDGTNTRTLVTDIAYDADYPLPTLQVVYEEGNYNTDIRRASQTSYYFRDSGVLSEVADNNLRTLVKSSYQKLGYTTLAKSEQFYGLHNGKVVVTSQKQYTKGQLTGESNLIYNDDGLLAETKDVFSGFTSATVYDDFDRPIAQVANATKDQVAFTSFERDDPGGWTYSSSFAANLGIIGQHAYAASNGSITRPNTLSGTYILSYWKNGTGLLITGPSSNTLRRSKTIDNWTYEERELVMTSTGTLTLSGNVALDNLRLYPKGGRMVSNTYDYIFGVNSETDESFNTISYEHDDAGRAIGVKDKNGDYLTQTDYEIAGFMSLSTSSISTAYTGGVYKVYVNSNVNWTISGGASFSTVTRTSNQAIDVLTITIPLNSTTSARNETITLTGAGLSNQTITLNQAAGPSNYLLASPGTINIATSRQGDITVTSNLTWSASVSFGSADLKLSTGSSCGTGSTISGSGNQTIKVCAASGTTGYRTISITGGGITQLISVYY
jgi:hypothetical protein